MTGSGDIQFTYMVLILPSLFGLTLVGEGMSKVLRQKNSGWVGVITGAGFMGVVVAAYLMLVDVF